MAITIESAPSAVRCPNCNATDVGVYCADCGQRQVTSRLTLRDWLIELADDVFSWEARLPRTLRALLLRPGLVAREWVDGRRARWTAPVRLYLLASVLMFALPALLPDDPSAGIPEAANADVQVRAIASSMTLGEGVQNYGAAVLFALVPLFAGFTRLLLRGSGLLYLEHLVFALHAHAVGFLAMVLVLSLDRLPDPWNNLDAVPMIALVVWLFYGARNFFRTSALRTAVAAGTAVFVYLVVVVFALLIVADVRGDSPGDALGRAHALYREAIAADAQDTARAATLRAAAAVAYQRVETHALNPHARYHIAHLLMIDGAAEHARLYAEEALIRDPDNLLNLGIAASAAEAMGNAAAAAGYHARFRERFAAGRNDPEYAPHVDELEVFRIAAQPRPEQ
ncbi:MAG: DUF3667 domain-containing protein [Gemmatimonadota bacterium]